MRFVYDYVDPGSYLAHGLLQRWVRTYSGEVAIEASPLELRPPGDAALDPRAPEWRELTAWVESEARRLDLPFRPPEGAPRTRKAHELAMHARERGAFDGVHAALFRAHFVDGLDLARIDVLMAVAEQEGLDPSEVRTVLGVDRFLPWVEETRAELLEAGVRGVPVLAVGGGTLEGFPGGDEFLRFLAENG